MTVCVQGLGFVGMAMALATASARRPDGSPAFEVIGVELDNDAGRRRVEAVNEGRLPITTSDPRMEAAMAEAVRAGNLKATTDAEAYESADVAIVDIGLDVDQNGRRTDGRLHRTSCGGPIAGGAPPAGSADDRRDDRSARDVRDGGRPGDRGCPQRARPSAGVATARPCL